MNITAYKAHKIKPYENIFEILDKYLPRLQEKNIVAIASKIIGICEGRVVKIDPQIPNQKVVAPHLRVSPRQPVGERDFLVSEALNFKPRVLTDAREWVRKRGIGVVFVPSAHDAPPARTPATFAAGKYRSLRETAA